MLQRKIYERLASWKNESKGMTALLIEGARRVGKSTIAEAFARAEYETYILIDFTRVTDEFKRMFLDMRTDLNEFFLYLSAYFGISLLERRSLIIFDEVQLFPQAREFIKHLVADGRYDYLETGSLVSLRKNVKDILLPSEEETAFMHPLDFEEFLWGMEERPLCDAIRSSFAAGKGLPQELHRKASRLWREYMLVGGMPQAVVAYGKERDIVGADKAKRAVLKLYRDDIEKQGGAAAKRIKAVFDAIPGLLSKHEKKLVYAEIEKGSRARDFMTAFTWLRDAMTVNICELARDPSVGLALSADASTLKCYMGDTGLLATMAFSSSGNTIPDVYREVLLGRAQVNEGMLAENAVAQQLVANGYELYFYSKSSNDREERMEVDFLVVESYANAAMKPRVSPIEVKSGDRTVTVSLDKFKRKFGKRVGHEFVIHPRQFKIEGDRYYLPLYMTMCL